MESFALIFVTAVLLGTTGYLIGSMVGHIRKEKRTENLKKIWSNFALSIAFCALFLVSWVAHGFAQWQKYKAEQEDHNQPVEVSEFYFEFSASTLENWQSEFLQLFSFVVLSALLIHHGSAESKDSDDRMEAALQRIEKKVGSKS